MVTKRGTNIIGVRVEHEPAFILHSYPFSDTSLILETFTRHHGRVAMLAKGAKRPRADLKSLLMPFLPLHLSWGGKNELKNFREAQWVGGVPSLKGPALYGGFYLNELLLKLTARDDAHEALFDAYYEAIARLAQGEDTASVLRAMEPKLLQEIGYGLKLTEDAQGHAIDPALRYRYAPERGPLLQHDGAWSGKTLLDLARDDFSNPTSAREAKALMRELLHYYLDGKPLATRLVFQQLQRLQQDFASPILKTS